MKKADKQIKMADLQFVDFVLPPDTVRKENQFGLPDDFFNVDGTILSRTSIPASGFPAVFRNTGGPMLCFTHRGRSKKFQHFRFER